MLQFTVQTPFNSQTVTAELAALLSIFPCPNPSVHWIDHPEHVGVGVGEKTREDPRVQNRCLQKI